MEIPHSPFLNEEIIDGEESAPPVKWREKAKEPGFVISSVAKAFMATAELTASNASILDSSIRPPRVRIEREYVYGYRVK